MFAQHQHKKRINPLPWLFVLLLAGVITAMFFKIKDQVRTQAEEKANALTVEQPPINVVVQRIEPIIMRDVLTLPGVAMASDDLTVMTEVGGQITGLFVREGDRVGRGAPLAQLDKRDYQATLESIEAQEELARLNFQRMEKLREQNAVSESEYDRARSALKELGAAMDKARLNLKRTTIAAPIAGVINFLPAKTGMLLSPSDPVAQILALDPIKIEIAVPESDLVAARNLRQCSITFAALGGMQCTGEKIFLASQPNSAAMAYTLWLGLANGDHSILPGMFAEVELVRQTVDRAVSIPLYAVISSGDEKYVYVVEGGKAKRRSVRTDFLSGWSIHIEEGLSFGDQVVIVGQRSLEDGQPVNLVKEVSSGAEILP
jgi:membrane fusion protein (multidrug efflux system)